MCAKSFFLYQFTLSIIFLSTSYFFKHMTLMFKQYELMKKIKIHKYYCQIMAHEICGDNFHFGCSFLK
jgi:hypothetical protein